MDDKQCDVLLGKAKTFFRDEIVNSHIKNGCETSLLRKWICFSIDIK